MLLSSPLSQQIFDKIRFLDENIIHFLPGLITTQRPHPLPFSPVLQVSISHSLRRPNSFASITIRLSCEPPWLVWWHFAQLSCLPDTPLLLFLFRLQIVGHFVLAQLERSLIDTEPTVGWADEGPKCILWAMVQRDRVRGEVEGRPRWLLRVTPEEDVLGLFRRGDGKIWVKGTTAGTRLPHDELGVPSPCNLVRYLTLCADHLSCDLVSILPSPSSRLEGQDTLITCAMILDLPT